MGWKKLPYWLMGGVIGLIVSICIFLLFFTFISPVYDYIFNNYFNYAADFERILSLITLSFYLGFLIDEGSMISIIPIISHYVVLWYVILVTFSYFVIGSIIGWIYGKIKQRKK
ncbi:hypothetical protein J4221_00590 [Candidatus Pacearchaeota archaeon]|nr:hypothetical protein [Candidatus Pacearchaeota archaeon]